jgi:hypothetical protein
MHSVPWFYKSLVLPTRRIVSVEGARFGFLRDDGSVWTPDYLRLGYQKFKNQDQ